MIVFKRILNSIKYRLNLKYYMLKYFLLRIKKNKNNPKVLNSLETLKRIKDNKLSISRYGDGEFYLMWGIDLPFQKHNLQIENELKEVISNQNNNILIGLPDTFDNIDAYTRSSKSFWKSFMGKYYKNIFELLPKNYNKLEYANTNCTRFYSDLKDKDACIPIIKKFKEIFHDRNIICIEGEKSRLGVGNDLFSEANSFKRILVPAKNAYEKIDDVMDYIVHNFSSKDEYLFILAIGPTATILAYRLWKCGYQALDLGHIDIQYEYYLRKARKKIAIPGKYTNENINGRNPTDEIIDKKYNESIIYKCCD